jgi:hypothetical protein
MAYTDWMIKTKQIGTCSCDYGCPCEFNALPTRTPCEGAMAMEIGLPAPIPGPDPSMKAREPGGRLLTRTRPRNR